jgi:DNA adenine methylase
MQTQGEENVEVNDVVECKQRSPIGWMGGKSKLRATIINCMPRHKCYVEVFAGSATVFFGKPARLSKVEVINDVHGELVNLMKVLSGTCFDESVRQEFIGYVRSMPAAREVFEDWQKWTADKVKCLSYAQRAFRYYYCVKNGFSSDPTCGYAASPFGTNRYNMATDFEPFTARFRESGAQVENLDFVDLITKYNRSDAGSFFFMDPPYFVTDDRNYYEFVFDRDKHVALKNCSDEIDKTGNTFLITYDDVQDVFDLYKDYFIYRTDPIVYQSADERGTRELKKTELFVTNYDIHQVLSDKSNDLFEEVDADDDKIHFGGKHIGLTRVQKGHDGT